MWISGMTDYSDKVYVRITSTEDQMDREVYLCRRKVWESMSSDERNQELYDRIWAVGIFIEIDCVPDAGDE